MKKNKTLRFVIVYLWGLLACPLAAEPDSTVRFATFNVSFHRKNSGDLIEYLSRKDQENAKKIAEIIQRVRPDVLLLNEVDFDESQQAIQLFEQNYLAVSQNQHQPIAYAHRFSRPVNTGVPSEMDLDGDGQLGTPNDAFGYGAHPGQYGMVVLSRFPIDAAAARTFQNFLWKSMPDAESPIKEDGQAFYSPAAWQVFRLTSKSHWDVPVQINGQTVHFLVSHPTPPVFDGPEDRNGRRNHDEIRFWADYISPDRSAYIVDDSNRTGGLKVAEHFVIAGDQNADPADGDSSNQAILQLLEHPLVNASVTPTSEGAVQAAAEQGGVNESHKGDPAADTSDFGDRGRASGNLRIDYVLPSKTLTVINAGVFWPKQEEEAFDLISATDHRLVWIDLQLQAK